MKFDKNKIYNLLFVVLLALILIPNTRVWFMRQMAFSPSVNNKEEQEVFTDYNWQLSGLTTPNLDFNTTKNKVVFVNFWATWCPPCRAEMPMIQELYNDYKDKMEFVFVTTDSKQKVDDYYADNAYDFPTYAMQRAIPEQFAKTNSIPASYLIDKKGNIVISKTGAADWNSSKVRKLLDELLDE